MDNATILCVDGSQAFLNWSDLMPWPILTLVRFLIVMLRDIANSFVIIHVSIVETSLRAE